MSQQSHFYLHMHSIPTSPDQSPEHYEGMEDAYSTKIANGYEEFNNDEVTDKAPVFFENKPESFNGVAFSFEEQAKNLRTEDESIPFSGKLTRTLPRIVPEEEPLHRKEHCPLKEANATELPEAHTKERENVPNRKVVRLPARSRSNTAQSEGSTRNVLERNEAFTGRSKSLPPSRGELDEQRNATGIKPEDPGGQLEDTLENNGESEVLQEDPVTFYLRRHRSSSHSITSNVVTPSSTRPGSASVGISRGSSFSSISRATDVGQSRGKGNGEDGKRGDSSSKGNAAAAIVAGPNLYEIVHSNIRRMNTLSPNERGRYPTLTDPGPPEESAAVDGEAVVEPSVEIEKLSQLIGSSNLPIPAFLRRRGILYGRIGKYEESLTDLSKAIQYDPFNSDALWHRHQLHLRLHNVEGALKDLDAITDSNKLHLGAFQSKARIYQEVIKEERQPGLPLDTNVADIKGMVKLAIVNYSQVIRLKPEDPDGYYQRACLFELENEMVYANEDFKMVRQLDPSNEHAIHNLAVYSFQRQLWDDAIQAFTKLLRLNALNGQAFLYRGRAYAYLAKWDEALRDLTMAIQLAPDRADVFYHPVLYYKLKKYDLAIIDYTTVVDLEPSKSIAWLNLGIIFMRYFNEFYKALECFNKAIQHDKRAKKPRVLASMSFIDRAIRDYSKAIHMIPSDHLLYLYRGKLLLKQGRMKESTYDFHSAFELNSSIAQTFVQYKQIISEFNQRSKLETIEDPALFMLIAKARVKCNDNEALEYNKKEPQIYLQRGICYENLKDWPHAIAEFSRCIAQNPGFAKAHYHRGLCKLHEGNSRGVVDLDRALKYDPKFFEAYLTRASYYHARGAYTEGIEDCNEALKLEPTSIRAHLLRGACKCKLHQYGLAIVDFTKAIQLDKACHFAFYNRAVTFQLLDDLDNAIKDYSIVLLLHNDSNAYRNRGLIYWKQGDAENALLDLYAARDNFPGDARLHGLLALCLQKVGRISESLDAFSSVKFHSMLEPTNIQAIRVNPYLIEAYLGRGNVYASINDSKSARRDYARVIHLYPKCTEAYVNMGYTMQMENRFKKSWELFTMAIAIQPKCTPALEGRAVVHCSMRNYFGALVDVSRAIRRWEMAFQYYNEALALDPKDVSAILNRGITQAMLEDMDGALNDFNQAIKMSPRRAEIYFNRAAYFKNLENTSKQILIFPWF
ncbi:hypothetical protein BC829DRAFT_422863 [Chytridium lagenaria]|nr:hypothetical protein BC829DRAFT_422863 [Chytridium lagenaria]